MAKRKTRITVSMILILALVSFFSVPMSAFASVVDPLNPGSVGSLTNPGDVQINKSAEKVADTDNEYQITLEVKGLDNVISGTTTDVVLVLDKSGSMAGTKLLAAEAAAKTFVNTLLPDGNTTNRVGLVTFHNTASSAVQLTTSPGNTTTGLIQALSNTSTTNGTFIQAGLLKAQQMLSASSATNKYIVLLSDGAPNRSYKGLTANASDLTSFDYNSIKYHNYDYGLGSDSYTVGAINVTNNGIPTVSEAKLIKASSIEIYTIGYGTLNADAVWVLENVASPGKYDAADAATIAESFKAIIGSITAAVQNGTVSDPIGPMYTYVDGSAVASAGTDVVFDGSTPPGVLNWDVNNVSEGSPATLTYNVTLNVDAPGFNYDTLYSMNGTTVLSYTGINGPTMTEPMYFNLPQALVQGPDDPTFTVTYAPGDFGTFDAVSTSDLAYGVDTPAPPDSTPGQDYYFFTGWSPEPTETVTKNETYVAQWTYDGPVDPTFTVTYAPGDYGTFDAVSTSDLAYGVDTPAPPDSTPGQDYYFFAGWSPEPSVTVEGNATYVAQWNYDGPEFSYMLTMSVDGNGSVDPSVGDHGYFEPVAIPVSADADSGWRFRGWNDDEGFTVPDESGNVYFSENDTHIYVEAIFTKKAKRIVPPDPTPPVIIIPEEPTPESPTIIIPPVVIDEPLPAAPAQLPKTGGLDASILYGLGALLASGGLVIRRKQK